MPIINSLTSVMRKVYLLAILMLIFIPGCKGKEHPVSEVKRDTTITKSNSYAGLFLDSLKVANFIAAEKPTDEDATSLRNFYNSRNYQFAWFNKNGLAEQTRAFWNLQQSFITMSKDSLLLDTNLSTQLEALENEDLVIDELKDELTNIELRLTLHFFKFAGHAYDGRVNPEELQWHIPRKKVNELEMLDSLIANKGQHSETWEPLNRQYRLLKDKLQEYYYQERAGAHAVIELPAKKTYKVGDSSSLISQVKKRLIASKDFHSDDTTSKYTEHFVDAVKQFQKRHGLIKHGAIDAALIKALNVPVNLRIKQMLINMERMRWLPKDPPGNFIVANIPDFKLHVFEDSKRLFSMDIIVGKAANRTIIFNEMLQYVVFSPYWNIPRSIVKSEILPAIQKNAGYLKSKNMEQTGFSNGLPVIRQKPGPGNSLGKVKFIFPNNYNIYFHDTPAKSLFKERNRMFSHGCIRLSEPEKLATYLLKNQPGWTPENIGKAMNASKEKWVKLDRPVPVVITYFTAWIDRDGLLNFRDDVYGHDLKMAELLFTSAKQ